MQGKGIIRFFLILFVLVAGWQYFLNVPINKIENQAERYAERVASKVTNPADAGIALKTARSNYLDSVSSEVVFSVPLLQEYTYADLKAQQLALGLDLKGGMSSVLQVDLKDFLKSLSGNSRDENFLAALNAAEERLKSEQTDYITLFGQEFAKTGSDRSLATIFSRNAALRDEINLESSDADVLRIIRANADETVNLTYERLKERIGGLGVAQPNVTLDANRHLILVELPGVDNPERAREFLQASAKLDFWEVYRISDQGIYQAMIAADRKLKQIQTGDTTVIDETIVRQDTLYEYITDDLGNVTDSVMSIVDAPMDDFLDQSGPLLSLMSLNGAGNQLSYSPAIIGVAEKNKMRAISEMLEREEIKSLFPRDLHFKWDRNARTDYETGERLNEYGLYAIKARKGIDNALLDGERVTRAETQPDPTSGKTVVSLAMDNQGAKIWANMTTKAAQDNNREIAIMLDDRVISAPTVNEPILGGDSQISGNFTVQEAGDLARFLRVGKLPAKTRIIQEANVGPSLGKENIERSIRSLLIGFGLVLLFMLLYYGSSGIVSIIALFANLFFIGGALASMGTVLTLPGIAGIVLTIGMAVDANVIIYERIREELREGKALAQAISDGFRNSYSAIIDANVTTILTAAVLAYFGLGPIKGFAVVLIVGVLSSLFTAVLLGRLMIDWWVGRGGKLTFWTGFSKNLFADLNIDWIGKRKMAYMISGGLILAGVLSMITRGFDLGVDFKGGYSYNVQFDQPIDGNQLRDALTVALGEGTIVKTVDAENTYNITTAHLMDDTSDDAPQRVATDLFNGVNGMMGGTLNQANFLASDGVGTHITSSAKVGPTIADDIKSSSRYATIFALLLIFLYIFLRFSKWQYSLGAVAALAHDTLIVLGLFSLLKGFLPFSLEIDQAFIAALLTVIGYSINDTVVVFDRIREFAGIYKNLSRKEIINRAVNSTVSRTVITSLTTLLVVAILLLFGGSSIKGFAFALFIGIIVGTYSSVFVATPLVYDLTDDVKRVQSTKGATRDAKKKLSV